MKMVESMGSALTKTTCVDTPLPRRDANVIFHPELPEENIEIVTRRREKLQESLDALSEVLPEGCDGAPGGVSILQNIMYVDEPTIDITVDTKTNERRAELVKESNPLSKSVTREGKDLVKVELATLLCILQNLPTGALLDYLPSKAQLSGVVKTLNGDEIRTCIRMMVTEHAHRHIEYEKESARAKIIQPSEVNEEMLYETSAVNSTVPDCSSSTKEDVPLDDDEL